MAETLEGDHIMSMWGIRDNDGRFIGSFGSAEAGGFGACWRPEGLSTLAIGYLAHLAQQQRGGQPGDHDLLWQSPGGKKCATLTRREDGTLACWMDSKHLTPAAQAFLLEVVAVNRGRPLLPHPYPEIEPFVTPGGKFADPEIERDFQQRYLGEHDHLHEDPCACG